MTAQLHYLLILDNLDCPILFKSYKSSEDDLNIQLHCYASLDFLEEKLQARCTEFLGRVYTIYNQQGEYSIYAFFTVTKLKILAIFKEEVPNQSISESEIGEFCLNVYKLYKRQLLQAFSVLQATGRFHKRFYEQLDTYVSKSRFPL
jgi:hypothetical protein